MAASPFHLYAETLSPITPSKMIASQTYNELFPNATPPQPFCLRSPGPNNATRESSLALRQQLCAPATPTAHH